MSLIDIRLVRLLYSAYRRPKNDLEEFIRRENSYIEFILWMGFIMATLLFMTIGNVFMGIDFSNEIVYFPYILVSPVFLLVIRWIWLDGQRKEANK